jgi:hypothetical protein
MNRPDAYHVRNRMTFGAAGIDDGYARQPRLRRQSRPGGRAPARTGGGRTLTLLIALLSAFAAGPGCRPQLTDTRYVPLDAGIRWAYQFTDSFYKEEFEVRVLRASKDTAWLVGGCWPAAYYGMLPFSSEGETVAYTRHSDGTYAGPRKLMNSSPAVGYAWQLGPDVQARVLGRERVSVRAGTFDDCVRVDYVSSSGRVTNWFAPGVGIVKSTVGGSLATVELLEWRPAR